MLHGKILNYGCGKNEDTYILKEKGYDIAGYDKYNPEFNDYNLLEKRYDVVVVNYVFNTIVSPREHKEVLTLLKNIGKEIYISVRSDTKAINHEKWTYLGLYEGWLTSANTFQRFYDGEMIYRYFGQVQYISDNSSFKLFKV